MINAHGGLLIDRKLSLESTQKIIDNQNEYPHLILNIDQIQDVLDISNGIFSPLTGFLDESDCFSVIKTMRLKSGIVWPIPILLDITKTTSEKISNHSKIILDDSDGNPLALLSKCKIFKIPKNIYCDSIFNTRENKHPGVRELMKMGDYAISGDIELLKKECKFFSDFNFSPAQTRTIFANKKWNTITAFQTRNVPHRGHEFLQYQALCRTDGLFIQPVVGKKKENDFKDEYILAAYDILIKKFFPTSRVLLGVLPLKMRYAGPKEALLHALIRKNFGCTHFIVGRDHAGVGDYYPPYAAQEIFEQFDHKDIEIDIFKFPEVVYYPQTKILDFVDKQQHFENFSGTQIRELIQNKQTPPDHLIRPEIYQLLTNSKNSMINKTDNTKKNNKKGAVLWFTGLSQSGKTTAANKVYDYLIKKGIRAERLDGDIVRESLTCDLGFGREDRDKNITRVGFVARLLSKNGVIVIASFISPFEERRNYLRDTVDNFIEIYVNTPLEVCERRDEKGLYAKARRNEINCFTGISDPYEPPKNPELIISPHLEKVEVSVKRIINYLENQKLID